MPSLRVSLLATTILLSAAPVLAQAQGQRFILESPGIALRQEAGVRIQNSVNFFLAGPTGDGEDAQKLRERARRTVYEMAAHECDLLREVLAKDCRLESVNNNITRQFGQPQQDGINVVGTMSFQITMKDRASGGL